MPQGLGPAFNPRGNRIDYTRLPGNPAYDLQKNYEDIMAMTHGKIDGTPEASQVAELVAARVRGIIKDYIGTGITKPNAMRWVERIDWVLNEPKPLENIVRLATNFILAASTMHGSRLSVIYAKGEKRPNFGGGHIGPPPPIGGSYTTGTPTEARMETIANMLLEDGTQAQLTSSQCKLIEIANSAGITICFE